MAQAQKVLGNSSPNDLPALVQKLLPDHSEWTAALAPFISRTPDPSLAITNAFGGSLSVITPTSSDTINQKICRDVNGNSAALRMAQYTIQIIKNTNIFESATRERKATVCRYMAIFLQLASDNLSVPGSMPLWQSADLDIESEIVDLVTEAQGLLGGFLHSGDSSTSEFIAEVQKQLLDNAYGLKASSYYSGRAFSALTSEIAELHSPSAQTNDADLIKGFQRSNDVFVAAAYLTSASESVELFRLCNYLLTDLTEHDFRKNLPEGMSNSCQAAGCSWLTVIGMRKLCLVSCIFSRAQDYVHDIPQQRLVFFVQYLIGQLEVSVPSSTVAGGQIMVVLSFVLPAVKEIYGPFWSAIVDAITQTGAQADLYVVHANLRLLNLLRKTYMLESNDDLLDAWSEKKTAVAEWLLGLLWQLQGKRPALLCSDWGILPLVMATILPLAKIWMSILRVCAFANVMILGQVTPTNPINHGE